MLILAFSLIAVCFCDYRESKIPNIWILAVAAEGIWRSVFFEGAAGAVRYFLMGLLVICALFPVFCIGGLGAGDVKLLGVCAGFFPSRKVFWFLFFSLLISVLFAVALIVRERDIRRRVRYFFRYCEEVLRSGKWKLYHPGDGGGRLRGIRMSGPILCSVLLSLGGVY